MKRFLTTTAIAALTAMPLYAQTETGDEMAPASTEVEAETSAPLAVEDDAATGDLSASENDLSMTDVQTERDGVMIRAADLSGHTVYIPAEGESLDMAGGDITDPEENWEEIGEVGDVVLTPEGEIRSITLDAGGFLGMGERHVETSMDDLRFIPDADADSADDYFIIYTGNRAALEEQDEFDRAQIEAEGNVLYPTDQTDASGLSGDDTINTLDADVPMDKDQHLTDANAMNDELMASELEGQTVYGIDGENIGEISSLVLDDNGEISEVIVDVGGFLGLGEKPVALAYDELNIRQDESAMNSIEVSTDYTEADLEGMEEWVEE